MTAGLAHDDPWWGGIPPHRATAPCPPEHSRRLSAAGASHCPTHGCPLCGTDPFRSGDRTWPCTECTLRAVDVVQHEGPPTDPWCINHGVPTLETTRACGPCAHVVAEAKLRGWFGPTGHVGADCLHCSVCGRCAGTGLVCRDCERCWDHPVDLELAWPDCAREATRWTRPPQLGGVEVITQGFLHSYFDPTTGQWAA